MTSYASAVLSNTAMQAAVEQLNSTHGPDAISDLQTSLATLSQQLTEQRDRVAQLANNITDELDALVNESTASLVDETGVLAALREQNNSLASLAARVDALAQASSPNVSAGSGGEAGTRATYTRWGRTTCPNVAGTSREKRYVFIARRDCADYN